MNNFKRIIWDFLNFIKEYFYVAIFEKLYIKSIFALEEIPVFAFSNRRAFFQLTEDQKKDLMKGLEHISEYNQDFDHLRAEYLLGSQESNFDNFQDFLRTENSGYYYKKAGLKYIFKVILVLSQLLILYYNYPKYSCINESIGDELNDDNTLMFWICENEKYKVKMVSRDRLFDLRILSFFGDFFLIIFEFFVLFYLRRIKANLKTILIVQFYRFSIYFIMLYYEFRETICDKSVEENIFYKKERKLNFLEIMNYINDIYKFFIY